MISNRTFNDPVSIVGTGQSRTGTKNAVPVYSKSNATSEIYSSKVGVAPVLGLVLVRYTTTGLRDQSFQSRMGLARLTVSYRTARPVCIPYGTTGPRNLITYSQNKTRLPRPTPASGRCSNFSSIGLCSSLVDHRRNGRTKNRNKFLS